MNLLNVNAASKALLVAGGLFIGWAANAQNNDNNGQTDPAHRAPMHRRGDVRQKNTARFTPEQRKQMMEINKDFHEKSAALFAKDNITLKEYKSQLLALQKDKKAKTEALLTPEQKQQMEARKKARAENAQVMAAAHMERLKLKLSLTDDQVAKLKAGQADLHSQMKAIHENDNLLPQQKMDQLKGLMAKRKDVYKAVLTPDQFAQFEKLGEGHRRSGFNRQSI